MNERRSVRTGGLVTLAVTGGYIGSFWNAYLSPTTGGELWVLAERAAGHLPYRDSYFPSQPLPFLLPFLLEPVFGRRLIVTWAIGVVLRLAAAACLYDWLARVGRPWAAAVASVATFVVASGDIGDFPSFYNHVVVSLVVIGTFLAWQAIGAPTGRGLVLSAAGGALLAAGFLTKQTTGLLVPAAVGPLLVAAALVRRGPWHTTRLALAGILGAGVPFAAVYSWIARHGLWTAYVSQVFLKAPSSKGGLLETLARPFVQPFQFEGLAAIPILAAGAACVLVVLALHRPGAAEPGRSPIAPEIAVAVPLLAAVLLGRVSWLEGWFAHRAPLLSCAYAAMLGSGLLGLAVLVRALRDRADRERDLSILVLAALGFSCAYSLSISWSIFEQMAFPGLAILVTLALSGRTAGRPTVQLASRGVILALCAVVTLTAAWRKWFLPYSWIWSEPPLFMSRTTSALPELAGFVLSPSTALTFEGVTALVKEHSRPDEKVWVYPAMQVFYGLADRRPATFATHQWMDTCPDEIAREDAARLVAAPPAVIVAIIQPPQLFDYLEGAFRGGRPSGQRALQDALAQLLPRYTLVGRFGSRAVVPGLPIHVFALRRDGPATGAAAPPR